jgi:hypothetical protein
MMIQGSKGDVTMRVIALSRRALVVMCAATLFAAPTLAHHGWAWTDEEKFELTGAIQEVFIGNPHAVLTVEADDGVWTVELAPPSRTRAAGFDESAAHVGDQVTAIGNRSSDHSEKRMKAVQLVVNGKTFDIYPDRVGS